MKHKCGACGKSITESKMFYDDVNKFWLHTKDCRTKEQLEFVCPNRTSRPQTYDHKNFRDCPTINDAIAKVAREALTGWPGIISTINHIENITSAYEDRFEGYKYVEGKIVFKIAYLHVLRTGPTPKDYKIFIAGFGRPEMFEVNIDIEVKLERHNHTEMIMTIGDFNDTYTKIKKIIIDFSDCLHMSSHHDMGGIDELGMKRINEAIKAFHDVDIYTILDAPIRCPKCGDEVRRIDYDSYFGLCFKCHSGFNITGLPGENFETFIDYVEHHPILIPREEQQ